VAPTIGGSAEDAGVPARLVETFDTQRLGPPPRFAVEGAFDQVVVTPASDGTIDRATYVLIVGALAQLAPIDVLLPDGRLEPIHHLDVRPFAVPTSAAYARIRERSRSQSIECV
jgi:hypothetical protein